MIFKKRNITQHPIEVQEHPKIPGVYVVDGLFKHDWLRDRYAFLLRETDWRFVINSGVTQVTTYPPERLHDVAGDNKMWGFSIYEEVLEPPYSICSTEGEDGWGDASKYQWLFDMAANVTQQLFDCPYDVWGIHMNGQTRLQDAQIHADTGDNLVIYLTPDWKPEWGGGLGIFESRHSEKPIEIVEYRSGRVIFYHGVKGHKEGYKFIPRFINDNAVWHQGLGPTAECTELRISMNIRGKALWKGAPVNEFEERDVNNTIAESYRSANKNLLEGGE